MESPSQTVVSMFHIGAFKYTHTYTHTHTHTHTQIHTHLWPNEISTGKCQTPVYYFFYTWIYRTHRLDKMMSCFSPNNCLCSRVFDIKSYIYKALFLRSSLEIYVSIFNSGSHHSELWDILNHPCYFLIVWKFSPISFKIILLFHKVSCHKVINYYLTISSPGEGLRKKEVLGSHPSSAAQ